MATSLSFDVVSVDGEIDLAASLVNAEAVLVKHKAERETEVGAIAEAVSATFDQYKGARINMPALQNAVFTRMNGHPAQFKILSERVADFVRENAGERESGATYSIGKGKGGGVGRWADLPVKAEKSDGKPEAK